MSPAAHLPYFFTDPDLITAQRVVLTGAEARHLKVRRAAVGDIVLVSDGAGVLARAAVESVSPEQAVARVLETRNVAPPSPRVTVYQGLAKSGKVDWVVEKSVELGIDEIVVFASGRSVPVWEERKQEQMLERWRRVALAAAKQSHRTYLPVVRGVLGIGQVAEEIARVELALVGDPESPVRLRDALSPGASVGVVVGPEGGLQPDEVQAMVDSGARAVGLGAQVLRTETAGLAMCSVVLHHVGRLG